MAKLVSRLLGTVLFLLTMTFSLLPAEAGLISRESEIEMGKKTAQQLEAQYGLYHNQEAQDRVERIGQRLAKVSGRTDIDYSFKVLNCNEVNALACPGGFIYVYRGLLDYMTTDTELAGVLGHEVGHVAKKHIVHTAEKQLLTSALLLLATKGQAMQLMAAAQQALFAGYSRTDERGADKAGVENTIKAGFNPYAVLITVSKLDDLAKKGGGANYGLFSSHPEPEKRIANVQKQLKKYKISPQVKVISDDEALVEEGKWSLRLDQSIGSNKAKYRAYMLAGGLWQARQRGPLKPNYFLVSDYGSRAEIYYDDIELLTVYRQDGAMSPGAYAQQVVARLRELK